MRQLCLSLVVTTKMGGDSSTLVFGSEEGGVDAGVILNFSDEKPEHAVRCVKRNISHGFQTTYWSCGLADRHVHHFFTLRFDQPSTLTKISMAPLPDDGMDRKYRVVARQWLDDSHLGPWVTLMGWRSSLQPSVLGTQPLHTLTCGQDVSMCGFQLDGSDDPIWSIVRSGRQDVVIKSLAFEQHSQVLGCNATSSEEGLLEAMGEIGMLRIETFHETVTSRSGRCNLGLVGLHVHGRPSAKVAARRLLDDAIAAIDFTRGKMSGDDNEDDDNESGNLEV